MIVRFTKSSSIKRQAGILHLHIFNLSARLKAQRNVLQIKEGVSQATMMRLFVHGKEAERKRVRLAHISQSVSRFSALLICSNCA
jgi:hypothetical protein